MQYGLFVTKKGKGNHSLTHPPLSAIHLCSRGDSRLSSNHLAMSSTCPTLPILATSELRTPPSAIMVTMRPQFTPSLNSSSLTLVRFCRRSTPLLFRHCSSNNT